MRRIKYLTLAALVAFAACDEDTVAPGVQTGTVQVTVTAGGTGVAGVTVSLGAAGTVPAQTSAAGQVTFSNVAAGSYVASISGLSADYACSQTSQPVVVAGGLTTSIQFACNVVQTASVTGSVSNTNGSARAGASVTITRTAPAPAGTAATVTTGTTGQYSLTGLRSGTYSVVLGVTPDCTVAATTQNVTIVAGEARVVNFTCTTAAPPPPSEPATAAIESITAIGFGGVPVPIPDNAIAGIVNVNIDVTENDQRVTRVELLLGSQVVCTHTRTIAAPEDMQLADFEVICVVNTAEFNRVTGVPRFLNTTAAPGNNVFTVRLYTVAGGSTPVATASRTIALVNVDFTSVSLTPERTVISGPGTAFGQGLLWWNGDLTANILPVMYSGVAVSRASLRIGAYEPDGTDFADYITTAPFETDSGTETFTAPPFSIVLRDTDGLDDPGVGGIEDVGVGGGGALSFTVTTIKGDGTPGPGAFFSTICDDGLVPSPNPPACLSGQPAAPIRIDNFGPVLTNIEQLSRWSQSFAWVPPPAPESGTGTTRWVHEGHVFDVSTDEDDTHVPVAADRGTGLTGDFFTFRAGTATDAMTVVEDGGDLAETLDNNQYFMSIEVMDIAGNTRTRFNDGDPEGTGTSTANRTALLTDPDARIGADHHNPFVQLLNGANLNANTEVIGLDGTSIVAQYIDCHGTVDPATGVCTVDTFTSNPSGFPPNPVRTRIRRLFPALTNQQGCWVGNYTSSGANCRTLGTVSNQSGTTGNFDFFVGSYTTIHPLTGAVTTRTTAADGTVLATIPVGYYRNEMQVVDAAGNLSSLLDVMFVRDIVAPVVGGVAFPALLTPGQQATFQAGVIDDLDLNRGEGFLVFGTELDAFRQSVTQIGEFGPAVFTQSANLSTSITFIHSLQAGSAAPPTASTQFAFRVSDFGRNSNTAYSGTFPPPTAPLRNYTVGTPSQAITAGSENLTSTVNALCWDTDSNGCPTTTTSSVLAFSLSGAGSAVAGGPLTIPFTRAEFYVALDENNDGVADTDVGGNVLWTSLGVAGVAVTENVGATVRTYSWSRSVTGSELGAAAGRSTITAVLADPTNNVWIRVVGYSSDGNAFTVADGALACPAPGSVPPGTACSINLQRN